MAIERTAANLAKFCLEVIGTAYWMGCYGQKASRSLYNQKKSDYPQYYPPKSWTEASFVDDFGKPVTDCAGLFKWFLWAKSMADKTPTYKASEDVGSNTLWKMCKEKGKINTLPANKIGIAVFNVTNGVRTHVGFIVDNSGTVVEAKGHAYGVVKSKASSWDEWGKLPFIKYDDSPSPEPPKDTYTVHTNSGDALRLRLEPNTTSEQVGWINDGDSFTSDVVVEGENVDGVNTWVKYNQGYASGKYLTPTPVIPEPTPTPELTPTPEPTGNTYKVVNIHTYLAIRSTPVALADNKNKVGELYNGAVVTVLEEKGNWARISGDCWVSMTYLKKV